MALVDLHKDLLRATAIPSAHSSQSSSSRKTEATYADENIERELTTAVLKTLVDSMAEVKNASVSW